jgi:hypothetical protein
MYQFGLMRRTIGDYKASKQNMNHELNVCQRKKRHLERYCFVCLLNCINFYYNGLGALNVKSVAKFERGGFRW